MTFALLASAKAASSNGNNVTTAGIDTTGARLLVVHVAHYHAVDPSSVTDSGGNSWTAGPVRKYASGGAGGIQTWYCLNPSAVGSGHTFTVSGTGCYPGIVARAFSGDAAVAFDAETGAFGDSSAFTKQPGSLTPAGANELFVIAAGTYHSTGVTVDSGFDSMYEQALSGNSYAVHASYKIATDSAAQNPTFNFGVSSMDGGISMLAFSEGAGAETTAALDALLPALEWAGAATSPTLAALAAQIPALAWAGGATMQTLAALAAELPPLGWAGAANLSPGTLTSRAFHNGAVLPLTSGAIPYVLVCSLDLAAATRFTAQSFNGSGLWTATDAAIVTGTDYLVLYSDGAGVFGAEVLSAS